MDTRQLVVGQDVYVVSGCYLCRGKVVKVKPEGVEVQTIHPDYQKVLLFDNEGKATDEEEVTPEFAVWVWTIDDKPFAEREAELSKKPA